MSDFEPKMSEFGFKGFSNYVIRTIECLFDFQTLRSLMYNSVVRVKFKMLVTK